MDSSVALGRLELACPLVSRGSCLPEGAHLNGCVPLSHQVAGHKYGVDKVGILQHPDGTVLKQLQPPPRGPREMQFYRMVYAEDCCDSCLVELRAHLPKYYGMWSSPDAPADLYLKLEDVTKRFQKPCIMDVKIGQKSYDPFASQEKREQQIRKYPLMEEIGFLVLGMRVYKPSSDSFDTYDQHYGRGLVKDTIKEGFTKFFYNDDSLRKDAITASILKVRRILHWFEGQSRLNFYASSLLFVYEGACGAVSVQNSHSPPNSREQNNNIHLNLCSMFSSLHKKSCVRALHQATNGNRHRQRDAAGEAGEEASGDVEVKMIDFAHVFPSDVHDQGFIYGLKNLLKVLQQVLDQ